jgi:hypothetical protein
VDLAGQLENPNCLVKLRPTDVALLSARPPARTVRLLQPQRRLSEPEAADLADQYRHGSTVRQLAEAFGIHRTTVLSLLAAAGIERRGHQPKLTSDHLRRAIASYERGHSCATIAKELAVHPETVRRALMKAGVSIRSRRGA